MSSHKTSHPHSERNRKILLFFMVLCALGFLLSLFFFVRQITDVRDRGLVHPRSPMGMMSEGGRGTQDTDTITVESIDVWMTFSYINFRFHLSPEFLREKLGIDDPRYPEMSVRSYIKKKNLDKDIFLREIQTTVQSAFSFPVPSSN